jgi:cyclohexanecarboxylate-CoA ligase/acyl-CoA synthetase
VPLYGCPEVMVATCCHLGDTLERMSGSDGQPAFRSVQIKVVGVEGEETAPGAEGEICYRGPARCSATGASRSAPLR